MKGLINTVLALALVGLSASASAAHISVFQALLNGDQADSGSLGLGSATATFNSNTNAFDWLIAWEGLTDAPTAGHFHGPAAPGDNAGVQVAFDHTVNPTIGSATLSTEQADQLFDELWYINVHTAAFPGGEIRGQVLLIETVNAAVSPVPLPAAALLMLPAMGGLAFARRRRAA